MGAQIMASFTLQLSSSDSLLLFPCTELLVNANITSASLSLHPQCKLTCCNLLLSRNYKAQEDNLLLVLIASVYSNTPVRLCWPAHGKKMTFSGITNLILEQHLPRQLTAGNLKFSGRQQPNQCRAGLPLGRQKVTQSFFESKKILEYSQQICGLKKCCVPDPFQDAWIPCFHKCESCFYYFAHPMPNQSSMLVPQGRSDQDILPWKIR